MSARQGIPSSLERDDRQQLHGLLAPEPAGPAAL